MKPTQPTAQPIPVAIKLETLLTHFVVRAVTLLIGMSIWPSARRKVAFGQDI